MSLKEKVIIYLELEVLNSLNKEKTKIINNILLQDDNHITIFYLITKAKEKLPLYIDAYKHDYNDLLLILTENNIYFF